MHLIPNSFLPAVLSVLNVSINLFRSDISGISVKRQPRARKRNRPTCLPCGASIGSNACYSAVRK